MLQPKDNFFSFTASLLPRFELAPLAQASHIARFIEQGYANRYQAEISVSMPLLLQLRFAGKTAAIGIRRATEPLFLEHYLDAPIESYATAHIGEINREQIVEYGSLFSNGRNLSTPLFMLSTLALVHQNVKALAFCATHKVASILERYGLKLIKLVKAEAKRLPNQGENWGSYYRTNPHVYLLSLDQLNQVIRNRTKYLQLYRFLSPAIGRLANKFEARFTC